MSVFSRNRAAQGFTLVELIVVMAILAIVSAVVIPRFFETLKRQKIISPIREIYSLVLATRMQAVRRNQQVIMFIDQTNRQITTWADSQPYNYIQDAGEPTLNSYSIPRNIYFRRAPAGSLDGPSSVAFDKYNGNAALVNLIIFRGDGTLLLPQAANSAAPLTPSVYTASVPYGSVNCQACRGIFLADNDLTGDAPNRNVFRIGVDDMGRVTLLKWIPTTGTPAGNGGENDYVTSRAAPGEDFDHPWNWVN